MSTIFDLDGISYHSAFAEIEERIYEIKENNNVATPRERRLINSLYNGINSDSISRNNSRITSRGNSRSRSRGNSRSRSSTRSKSKSKRKNRNKITRRKRTTKRK